MSEPVYTTDWHLQNIPIWEQVLAEYKGKPLQVLELGTYEGRSAIWLLDNILTNPESHITCVDSWNGGGELDDHDWKGIEERFKENTKPYSNITAIKSTTTDYLRACTDSFDLIYVDAGHFAPQALIDSVLSHLVLRPGGIIIFDDYLIGGLLHTPITPKTGIDAFMECFAQEYDWLAMGYQAILRKKPKEGDK